MSKERWSKDVIRKEHMSMTLTEIQPNLIVVDLVIPNENHDSGAVWVSEQTSQAGTMLPKSVEEVLSLFKEGRSILLVSRDGNLIAHASISFLYEEDKTLEIGGLIVASNMRHLGYGRLATWAVLGWAQSKYPGWKKIALCNQYSLPLMMKFGAIPVGMENADLLPQAVWEACATCPNLTKAKGSGHLCCDTPVIIP